MFGEFAYLFPSDVAGIMLVDPAPESFYDSLAKKNPVLWDALEADLKNAPPGAAAQMSVNAATVRQINGAWPLPNVIENCVADRPAF